MPLYKFFQEEEEKLPRAEGHSPADPRPDLASDTDLWATILALADETGDDRLVCALIAIRSRGTQIETTGRGSYALRPIVEPTGRTGWESRDGYERARKWWLEPHREEIARLLKALRGESA